MHEIDFLPVGDGKDSGDAIAFRFIRPDNGEWAHVIVDAGFDDDGEALVAHVKSYYGTHSIDLAILTHPDGDHIGGMGKVIRGLNVNELWLHDIGEHGGSTLRAAVAVKELINTAHEHGTRVVEPWAGASNFGGALTVLGPSRAYYEELVAEQVAGVSFVRAAAAKALGATRGLWERVTGLLGEEVPFAEKEVSPRNNSSIITILNFEGSPALLTADAGVPAIDRAWDYANTVGLDDPPSFVQIPHHGSRRNASSEVLDRIFGPAGQDECRTAFVSCVPDSEKHPSGKVINAYIHRGCRVIATAGRSVSHKHGTPERPNWGPVEPLGPMAEEDE